MREKGFTIIEITIGLALLSTAMLVATMTYVSIARLQDKGAAARVVQQNGRYALESIERDIRNAGAVCVKASAGSTTCTTSGNVMDLTSSIQGGGQIEYTYCASSCPGGINGQIFRDECNPSCPNSPVSVSSQDVRIINGIAGGTGTALFQYVQDVRPFVKVHLEVQQKLSGLTQLDSYYAQYNLDTTVTTRE